MSKYELTFLVKKEENSKKIKELILKEGGRLLKEEKWGEKILAYPIKKSKTAFFYNWLIDIPTTKISSLKKNLDFSDKILRYLLLKKDDKNK